VLSVVIRAGAGTNNIDIDVASQMGIYVANCPGKNAIAVAEVAMGHLLNMDRRISDNTADLKQGVWNKKEYSKARGIYGLKLGLIGMGSIGKEVVKRAKAFGMYILVYSGHTFSREEEMII
jgi:D-3-phosphoglycerate dehydrogenase